MNQHQVDPSKCSALRLFPQILNYKTLSPMLIKVDHPVICTGQPDEHFVHNYGFAGKYYVKMER